MLKEFKNKLVERFNIFKAKGQYQITIYYTMIKNKTKSALAHISLLINCQSFFFF